MEAKKIDFEQFLHNLTPKITNYTEVHLVEVRETCISFTVRWIITHKHKNYRIICSQKQQQHYLSLLAKHLELYPIRKLTLSALDKGLAVALSTIAFDEIIYQESSEEMEQTLHLIFGAMTAKKVTFAHPTPLEVIGRIISFVHEKYSNSDINIQFKAKQFTILEAIDFLRLWGFSLPEKPTFTVQEQKEFGYPFPSLGECERTKRREHISVTFEEVEVFTLRQLDNMGCEVIFKQEVGLGFFKEIIEILIGLKRFASLQLEELNAEAMIQLVQLVITEFQEGHYRIVVGHQIELTSNRLILNTTGLTKGEVARILELMKLPGHYQFICYSTAEHFPAAVSLFKAKPLVKFNFFLPLQELEPFEELIKAMDKHASQLLSRVYSYAGLLKKLAGQGYLAVNTIFYSLGSRP